MGVVAPRDERETGVLDIRNEAVADKVPACAWPHSREIKLRVIEARGEVIEDRGQAILLLTLLTERGGREIRVVALARLGTFCGLLQLAVLNIWIALVGAHRPILVRPIRSAFRRR